MSDEIAQKVASLAVLHNAQQQFLAVALDIADVGRIVVPMDEDTVKRLCTELLQGVNENRRAAHQQAAQA